MSRSPFFLVVGICPTVEIRGHFSCGGINTLMRKKGEKEQEELLSASKAMPLAPFFSLRLSSSLPFLDEEGARGVRGEVASPALSLPGEGSEEGRGGSRREGHRGWQEEGAGKGNLSPLPLPPHRQRRWRQVREGAGEGRGHPSSVFSMTSLPERGGRKGGREREREI